MKTILCKVTLSGPRYERHVYGNTMLPAHCWLGLLIASEDADNRFSQTSVNTC
jgi:hypothetical protein